MFFRVFMIWIFILFARPQDMFPFLSPLRITLTATILVVLASVLEKKIIPIKEIFDLEEGKRYILLYLVMILGIPFAVYRRHSFDFVFFEYIFNVLFFYLVIAHVDSLNKLRTLLFVVCSSTCFYGLFSWYKGSFSGGRLSYGLTYDPNDLAHFLVSLFPLAFVFMARQEAILKKFVALIIITVSPMLILMTGSRGGLLGLFVITVILFSTKLAGIKRSHKIVVLVTVSVILMSYGHNINVERLMSLSEIRSDYNVTGDAGRLEVWKTAFKIILSHPVTGVGANCFGMAFGSIRGDEGRVPVWKAAHNSYLQIAAEVGLIGFAIFISMIFICLKNFVVCANESVSVPEHQHFKKITGVLALAFSGHLVTGFFLSQGYSTLFTFFFAMSAIVRKIHFTLQKSN